MTTRTVSIEALAMRHEARTRHAEQDALMLQDDVLTLRAENSRLNAELERLKGSQDGTAS